MGNIKRAFYWIEWTFHIPSSIHTEEITSEQSLHILQVWLALPPEKRWAPPFWQKILLENVPKIKTDHLQILVYSGESNGLVSPLKNHTPLTLVDFKIKKGGKLTQEIPANFNGFIYVLDGAVEVGDKVVEAEQAGWLSDVDSDTISEISFVSKSDETHFVLYAAKSHQTPRVTYGPFIGDSMEDIKRLYKEYRNGEMPHLNDLPHEQKVEYA